MQFGATRFDRDTGQLLSASGEIIALSLPASKILAVLAANQGQAIPKEDLTSAATGTIVTDDDELIQFIAEIREALGAEGHALIRPVPGVGYRLTVRSKDRSREKGNTLKYLGLAVALVPVVAILVQLLLWAL
ncbi:MAG: winged helix-turn-helix domain-containing protein [Pseudomonadota bacterium]